jgi:hypothetical protein
MRVSTLFPFLLFAQVAMGQKADTVAAQPVDLHLAGYYSERAAELRQDRNLLVGLFLTWGVVELVKKNPNTEFGWCVVGTAAALHFGLEIPINRNEQRSARVLQGIKP